MVALKVRNVTGLFAGFGAALFLILALALPAAAQSFRITNFDVEGNKRIETSTIISFAGIERGKALSAAELNTAIQNVRGSGLFESVDAEVRGNTLRLIVVEYPTINKVAFEGNRRLSDDVLTAISRSAPRKIFSQTQAQADAAAMTEAYANQGRVLATVTPRIIERSDNRVDLVFEVAEGNVVEIERLSFVGNRSFGDNRLRRVLQTKEAGTFRLLVGSDTFVEDRIQFDKQVLQDFYNSRGYVDMETLSVSAELLPTLGAFQLTFRIREGQQFRFGEVTASSDLAEVELDKFTRAIRDHNAGKIYSPSTVDDTITRMERRAVELGLDFIRVEPRVTRNDADLTLDVEYVLSKGPRVFVERIDIEGNTTTLDQVIRRQFRVVEGDPFNPREIRSAAQRIRALGLFGSVDVNAREGRDASQVVVDVDVTEQSTGSFNFGANYNDTDGIGLSVRFQEKNFLGRGQALSTNVVWGEGSRTLAFSFAEPAFLNRDLRFAFNANYRLTDNLNARYDTESINIAPSLGFPAGENSRLNLRAFYDQEKLFDVTTSSGVISAEATSGDQSSYGLGYTYSFDTRRTGIDPNRGFYFKFGQDYSLGGDQDFIRTNLSAGVEWRLAQRDVTFSAELDGGSLDYSGSTSRVTDRFFASSSTFRGFAPGGLGPREINGADNDALGGNNFAVARFEARFPLGLPEEYGFTGGAFYDVGSVWGLDQASVNAANGTLLYEDFSLRSTAGLSLFWKTPIGPLRFNFSRPVNVESLDRTDSFDITIDASF